MIKKIHKRFIAEKDINVWKIIRADNSSEFRGFKYTANKTYPHKELRVRNSEVEAGYHAYTTRDNARSRKNGYRALKLVKFTIPKGTKYFFGDNNDIVAECIRSGDLIGR